MRARKLKKKSKEYFNDIAENQEIIEEPVLCYDIVMKKLHKAGTFRSLMDISCGTGEMLKLLSERYGDRLELHGVDFSEKSIAAARKKLPDTVRLQIGDVDALPMADACVDVALNMHSFHHYPHPVHALKEIRRILKDDGYFFLVENNFKGLRRHYINFGIKLHGHFQGDIKMYSRKELNKMLKKSGFKIMSREEIADHSVLYICRKG